MRFIRTSILLLLTMLALSLVCTAQHGAILSWTNPSSTETVSGTTLTLSQNNVYRSTDNVNWTAICCSGGPPITTYTDSTISLTTVYYYNVTAVYTLSGGTFGCATPCETSPTTEVEASVPTAVANSAAESGTIFTPTSSLPAVGSSSLVGSPLSLGAGSYIIIGTIATTLKNASTVTCWIVELPSTQISPLTYAGSETAAVTSLWLPLTMITSLTLTSTQSVQMECTNNAGRPELGPYTLTAMQVSTISN